ncbi:MAG: hypothetical protein N4A33_10680 [Bacteriovoracaceae bacterium]|jgi:hypothetical protein|nr:hypothetical protein [Bacteriovoracaceae bacterium]
MPMLFTENGVAMLSSVLNSKQAIKVNITIMRIFTELRSYYALEQRLDRKIDKFEKKVTKVFKVVFERLDDLDEKPKVIKKKIGLIQK